MNFSRTLNIVLTLVLIGAGVFWYQSYSTLSKSNAELETQLQMTQQELKHLKEPTKNIFGKRILTNEEEMEFDAWFEPSEKCQSPQQWPEKVLCSDERKAARDVFRQGLENG